MIHFECDYTEGAHPLILDKLIATNLEQTTGYGQDPYCETARAYIKKACHAPDADVHFLVGGTQTNMTVIASILRPYQGVIAASSGHINVHETGAIEATGHKVLPIPSEDGKITASQIKSLYDAHYNDGSREHTIQPGIVYISQPTENGTLYTRQELTDIYILCKACGLPLFLDGARLGYGLMAPSNDLSLEDIARLTDVFYIGGTKVGALFGEAVVIVNNNLKKDFRYHIKQRGGMLAKGRLLGIQFETLFENDLYYTISKHAITEALRIKEAFMQKGFRFLYDSDTNQQFPILSRKAFDTLSKNYCFNFWEELSKDEIAVRFCTSWATKTDDVTNLLLDIASL